MTKYLSMSPLDTMNLGSVLGASVGVVSFAAVEVRNDCAANCLANVVSVISPGYGRVFTSVAPRGGIVKYERVHAEVGRDLG